MYMLKLKTQLFQLFQVDFFPLNGPFLNVHLVTWFLPEARLSHDSLLKTSAQRRRLLWTAQCASDTQQMLQVTSKDAKPCLSSGGWAKTDVSRGDQRAVLGEGLRFLSSEEDMKIAPGWLGQLAKQHLIPGHPIQNEHSCPTPPLCSVASQSWAIYDITEVIFLTWG